VGIHDRDYMRERSVVDAFDGAGNAVGASGRPQWSRGTWIGVGLIALLVLAIVLVAATREPRPRVVITPLHVEGG
jgi:hypothetical protein